MGEIADMMIEGVLCQCCGCYIDDDYMGFPRFCDDCKPRRRRKHKRKNKRTKNGQN